MAGLLLGRLRNPPSGRPMAPKINDFRLRPKAWLQMARTLVSVAVAFLHNALCVDVLSLWMDDLHKGFRLVLP